MDEEEEKELRLARRILNDLDRCEHGRHEGDYCASCGGPSKGNPKFREGETIGYTLHLTHRVVVPPVFRRGFPSEWLQRCDETPMP